MVSRICVQFSADLIGSLSLVDLKLFYLGDCVFLVPGPGHKYHDEPAPSLSGKLFTEA